MKDVSIIVPVYNSEKYISRCIKSILNQTYSDYEVLFIDDCGTDNSIKIIDRYMKSIPEKIKLLHCEKNMGSGYARDLGIKNAEGKYIIFLDSDDYISKDFLKTYINAMELNDADLAVGGYIRAKNGKFKVNKPGREKINAWFYMSACNKMYKTSFLKNHGIDFRGIRRYEDEQFAYRVLLEKPKIEILDYAGYYYVYNDNSMTQNKKQDRSDIFMGYTEAINSFYDEIIGKKDASCRAILEYCIISGLTAALLYNAKGCGLKKMSILYETYDKMIKKIAGKKYRNKYITFRRKIRAEEFKTHYATWLVMNFRRFKIDKILFYIDSLL